VRYRSRDEFRRANPGCCKIVSHDHFWITPWHQLSGYAVKSVFVRYKVNYMLENGFISHTEAVAQRAVSCCGRVLNIR
jgi:hypothetical protein